MPTLRERLAALFRRLSGGKPPTPPPSAPIPPPRPDARPKAAGPREPRYQEEPLTPKAPVAPAPAPEASPPPAEPPPRPRPPRRPWDLVIGLDLGTSCTKVVIGDLQDNASYAVQFRPQLPGIERFLLPTRFSMHSDTASLDTDGGAASVANLKLALIEAVEQGLPPHEHIQNLAIYYALTLQATLDWFNSTQGHRYRDRDICWKLNFGLPTKRVTPGPLLGAYLSAGRAACRAINSRKPISPELVRGCMGESGPTDADVIFDPMQIGEASAYPEIAAQLAGYVKSPFHREGPLLLVDVGAGTLDVSTLILHSRDGDQVCSFHFCAVEPLGAFQLFRHRVQSLERFQPGITGDVLSRTTDPSAPIPERLQGYVTNLAPPRPVEDAFKQANCGFTEKCRCSVLRNVVNFKNACQAVHANGRHHHPFRAHLPFILSGGGGRLAFYFDLVGADFEEQLIPLTPWRPDRAARRSAGEGLRRIRFDLPRNLHAPGVTEHDFDRLSVAHGLAYGGDNLMAITAKQDPKT